MSKIKYKHIKKAFVEAFKFGESKIVRHNNIKFKIKSASCGNYLLEYGIYYDNNDFDGVFRGEMTIEYRDDFLLLFFGKTFDILKEQKKEEK